MKSSRCGATTRSVIRTCGLSVRAYFSVNESDRYGSSNKCFSCHCSRKPLCPSHQRWKWSRSSRAIDTSARNDSFWRMGFIIGTDSQAQFLPHFFHPLNHVLEFLFRRPARGLAEAAVGRKRKPLSRRVFQAGAHALGHVVHRLDIVALHVDNAHSHVFFLCDLADDFQLGKLAARHLDVNFIHQHIEKGRKHRRVTARADGPAFEISETEMRGEPAATVNRVHGAIENIDEASRVLAARGYLRSLCVGRAGRAPAGQTSGPARIPIRYLRGTRKTTG